MDFQPRVNLTLEVIPNLKTYRWLLDPSVTMSDIINMVKKSDNTLNGNYKIVNYSSQTITGNFIQNVNESNNGIDFEFEMVVV